MAAEMPRGGARKGAGRPGPEPTATRSIRLPVALWQALEALAVARRTTVNALVRDAVTVVAQAGVGNGGQASVKKSRKRQEQG